MALKIFAKKGTSKKVLVVCQRKQVRDVQLILGENYGGDWVPVDEMNQMSEILFFDDDLIYQGYHGKDERYCNTIKNING